MKGHAFPRCLLGVFLIAGVTLAWTFPASAAPPFGLIDFEGLAEGTIVNELSLGSGVSGKFNGTIDVLGTKPSTGNTNSAMIFDSSDPTGGDFDLGTPNEVFGGPGIGAGGETGQFKNDEPLGNILIVSEDLDTSDPDDADELGMRVDFDFSVPVKVNSITIMDVEAEQGEAGTFVELCEAGEDPALNQCDLVGIPATGNNGVVEINGLGAPGVELMRVNLNGSGAIEGIVFNAREPRDCWVTTGGFHNAGAKAGGKIWTFGGNVGPPSSGSWEIIDHTTGDNFHTHDVHIDECLEIEAPGPEQPGGKKGFTINKATWSGTGRLNGVDGFTFEGFVIDNGEPANPDYFWIEVKNSSDVVVFEVFDDSSAFAPGAALDGGNVQIHPPVGN